MAYVDLKYVSDVALIPLSVLNGFEFNHPGSFGAIAKAVSRMFDAKLHKRYATPFDPADPPEAIKWNVAQVVAYQVRAKIGYDPGSAAQDELIKEARDAAMTWLDEAANSKEGAPELPAREQSGGDGSAITRSMPLAHSDVTAYEWARRQGERARWRR